MDPSYDSYKERLRELLEDGDRRYDAEIKQLNERLRNLENEYQQKHGKPVSTTADAVEEQLIRE